MCVKLAMLLLLAAVSAAAQQNQPPVIATNLVASSSQLLDIPRFSFFGMPLCDDRGDVYFHVPLASNSINDSSVLKVSRNPEDTLLYHLPSDVASKTALDFFSVSPSGKVRFLDETLEGPLTVFSFDSDGTVEGQVPLDVPEHFRSDDFAVADNGAIFLSGHLDAEAPKGSQGKRFVAIFEKSGKLRSRVTPPDSGDVDPKAAGNGNGGTVAVGIDGDFYILRAEKIVVVSQSGETSRTIPFKKPASDLSASGLRLSAGLVAVQFAKADSDTRKVHFEFLVLDIALGSSNGLYQPPDDAGAPVCFSRSVGFIFLAKEDKKNKLVIYPMR